MQPFFHCAIFGIMSLDYVFGKPAPSNSSDDLPMSSPMLYRSDKSGVISPKEKKISLDKDDDPLPGYLSEKDEIPCDTEVPFSEPTFREQKGDPDEMKDEVKERKKFDFQCPACAAEIKETDRACVKCGQYIPIAGETFDISTKNFKLPDVIGQMRRPTEFARNEHEMPFPSGIPDKDLPTHPAANEWILNHLPLTEDQKEEFMRGEIRAQLGSKGAKILSEMDREKKSKDLKIKERRRIATSHLVAIKDRHKERRHFSTSK
jgi:hypothetical protein